MPITQERMIALIHAAQDYQQALDNAIRSTIYELQALQEGRKTPAECVAYLGVVLNPAGLLRNRLTTEMTIALEAQHFTREFASNQRARDKQRGKREVAGVGKDKRPTRTRVYATHATSDWLQSQAPPTTAPQSLVPANPVGGVLSEIDAALADAEDAEANPVIDLENHSNVSPGLRQEIEANAAALIELNNRLVQDATGAPVEKKDEKG